MSTMVVCTLSAFVIGEEKGDVHLPRHHPRKQILQPSRLLRLTIWKCFERCRGRCQCQCCGLIDAVMMALDDDDSRRREEKELEQREELSELSI